MSTTSPRPLPHAPGAALNVKRPTRTDLVAVGETMVVVAPEAGSRLDAQAMFRLHAGGAESNVAMSMARLGHRTAWMGRIGADPLGRLVLESLADAGVDVSLVEEDPHRPTGVYFKDPGETVTQVLYYRQGSAGSALAPSMIDRWSSLAPRVVHLSGITPALSDGALELANAIVDAPRPTGSVVSFDVNHRKSLWNGDAAEELLRLARRSDIVLVGRDEAESLWGTPTADSVRNLLPEPAVLVVKDGPHAATSYSSAGRCEQPALTVDVVDVVGAGDAFAAGWLSAWLRGLDDSARLRMGHWAAAQAVTSPGDVPELDPSDFATSAGFESTK